MRDFENVLIQTMGIEKGAYPLLPIKIALVDESRLPVRHRILTTLDLIYHRRGQHKFGHQGKALQGALLSS
jgi:hypothetical protein